MYYAKAFDCGSQQTVEDSQRDENTRPPYLSPEKSVCRTKAHQGWILSPCLFNLYAEYILQNTRLAEAQSGIKIARRNINTFSYADDTTLMAESKEELKKLLMKVIEESKKSGLKLNIQKTKIMASGSITSWQIDGEKVETVTVYFLGLKHHWGQWLQPWN